MKATTKIISLSLSSLLVVGLVLTMTVGALAADPLLGLLTAGVAEDEWSVGGVTFTVDDDVDTHTDTVCVNLPTPGCGDLAANMLVEVVLEESTDFAATITVLGGANTLTYTGELTEIADDYWMLDDTEKFWIVEGFTVLPEDFFGEGDMVKVDYKLSTVPATLGEFLAVEFMVVDSATSHTILGGLLESASGENWVVDGYPITVPTALQPPFFAPGDTVNVTFKIISGVFTAVEPVVVVNSGTGNTYTHEGLIIELKEGNTIWKVEDLDGDAYDFLVSEDLWPIYFGLQDKVWIKFHIVNQEYVALEVKVLETFVPPKTESERCKEDKTDQPAIVKLAGEVNSTPEEIAELFCLGFGIGEIKLAYRYAEGSEYTPYMLLALRAQGYGWGELKKLAQGAPAPEDEPGDDETEESDEVKNNGKPDKSKPDKGNPQDDPDDDDGPGNSEKNKDKNKDKDKGKSKNK
jgi:hypothetical protein